MSVAQAVVNYLSPERYRVEVVGDGAEVMAAVRRLNPDLILLDVNLPSVTGLELLRYSRATAPETAVILMTAFGSKQTAIDATPSATRYSTSRRAASTSSVCNTSPR